MTNRDPGSADRFREWDAAYVLGALSPSERLEFEDHLSRCRTCTIAVAELAGMPGLLGSIGADEAFALGAPSGPALTESALTDSALAHSALADRGRTVSGPTDAQPTTAQPADDRQTVLPLLILRARRSRRRSRVRSFAVGVGSLAAAAAIAAIVVLAVQPSTISSPNVDQGQGTPLSASEVQLVAQVPSPLSASATLADEPWGTRIEWKCTYSDNADSNGSWSGTNDPTPPPNVISPNPSSPNASSPNPGSSTGDRSYSMIVTDRSGTSYQVATWTSGPGTTATPTATTSIRRSDIASVSILAGDTGDVLLTSTL